MARFIISFNDGESLSPWMAMFLQVKAADEAYVWDFTDDLESINYFFVSNRK